MKEKGGGGKLNSTIPAGGAGFGQSSKQSSGKTKHSRMKMAAKVESLTGLPKTH